MPNEYNKKYDIDKILKDCQKALSYNFENEKYLLEAITHRTFANENKSDKEKIKYNQRLEFLGDSVLSLVMSDYLFKKYPNYKEGLLSKIKSSLVSSQMLSLLSKDLKLGDFILLGHGEEASGGRYKENILEDLFEAIVGAIYLDSNIDRVKEFIIKTYKDKLNNLNIEDSYKDYKTIFQEIIQKKYKINPKYQTMEIENNRFKSEVFVNNKSYAIGFGKSKKESEMETAKNGLNHINLNKEKL